MIRILLIAALLFFAGCQAQDRPPDPAPTGPGAGTGAATDFKSPDPDPVPVAASAKVDSVVFQVSPTPVHISDSNNPDGFEARIMLFRYDTPSHSISSPGGTIEFYMFDGPLKREQLSMTKPLAVWRFGPNQLGSHQIETMVGTAYEFTLGWGAHIPQSRSVTIFSRYLLPGMNPVEAPLIVVVAFP